MKTLQWGLRDVIPDDPTGAWGARAIITQDGDVDFPPDRCDSINPGDFLTRLERVMPLPTLRYIISNKLKAREIDTRVARNVIIYVDADISIVCNSNGSGGYLYISAWSTT